MGMLLGGGEPRPQIAGIGEGSGGTLYYRVLFSAEYDGDEEKTVDYSETDLLRLLQALGEEKAGLTTVDEASRLWR